MWCVMGHRTDYFTLKTIEEMLDLSPVSEINKIQNLILKLHDKVSYTVAAISFISTKLCLSCFTNNLQPVSLNVNVEMLKAQM